jgi:dTDP-4-amino-4,6-dideoxygalactose transaminase
MVVTHDDALAARMKVMRLHGISRDAFDRFTSRTPAWYYEIVAPGFKYNLTDMAAALGRVQLQRLPAFVHRRQQLAARYLEQLQGLPLVLPAQAPAGDAHAWHLFVLRLSDAARVTRDEVVQALSEAGIGTSVHFVPLHRQPYWRERYGLRAQDYPVAEAAYQRMFSIPLFTAMSDGEQARVVAALRAIVR